MKHTQLRRTHFLTLCALAGIANACGGSAPTPGSGDSAIWPANATRMTVSDEGGGFVGPAPTGSACQASQASYTLTVATRHFEWQRCMSTNATDPYSLVAGERALTQAEFDGLQEALRGVTASLGTGCGADKSILSLDVTTPDTVRHYLDDFYACNQAGSYVSGLDEVLRASSALAQ